MKYKHVERKFEVKRNKNWERFRFPENNQKNQNKTHNATSLLSEDNKDTKSKRKSKQFEGYTNIDKNPNQLIANQWKKLK